MTLKLTAWRAHLCKGEITEQIGVALRVTRMRRNFTLKEVEERSVIFAQEMADPSYRISASWLDRLERERHELTTTELFVLAHVYEVELGQFICSIYPNRFHPAPPSNGTMLLATPTNALPDAYKWGVVGHRDHSLAPLLPAGSVVQIDTRRREVGPVRRWTNVFERPIYFLKYKE